MQEVANTSESPPALQSIDLRLWAGVLLAPFAGGACRFHPTCSAYALDALTAHGVWRGGRLALARVAKCHPFGPTGIDPVPPSSR